MTLPPEADRAFPALPGTLSPTGVQYPVEIANALGGVMDVVKPLDKDGRNEFQKYDYASVDKFLMLTGPACAANDLIVKPIVISAEAEIIETLDNKTGQMKPRRVVNFWFKFRLIHTRTGVTFTDEEDRRPLSHDYIGPQTTMSAESYALKAWFRTLLQIPTGDIDADAGPQWAAEMAETKADARAAKKRRETGVDHVAFKFDKDTEEVPVDKVVETVAEHMVKLGTAKDVKDWWASQMHGRETLHSLAPKYSLALKKSVEAFIAEATKREAAQGRDDEPPFQDAAE